MFNLRKDSMLLFISLLVAFSTIIILFVSATPQTTDFFYQGGFWYDAWGYTRNYAIGSNGFMPNLAYEALGDWQGLAFDWGTQFEATYPNKIQRAEEILKFVQKWTNYGYDSDNVVIDQISQEEWAWNADEMANNINPEFNTIAIGDCEDMAFLCSALYEGAGFDTAMILTYDHAALLIWLPEYPNVIKWDINGDGRTYGWIWVEATGNNNPLGWTPETYRDGNWDAYVIESLYIHSVYYVPENPTKEDDVTVYASIRNKTSNMNTITLRYSDGEIPSNIDMERFEPDKYRGVIPRYEEGSIVQFEIHVTDQMGNSKSLDSFSYQVGNNGLVKIPDFILNTGPILIIIVILLVIVIAL